MLRKTIRSALIDVDQWKSLNQMVHAINVVITRFPLLIDENAFAAAKNLRLHLRWRYVLAREKSIQLIISIVCHALGIQEHRISIKDALPILVLQIKLLILKDYVIIVRVD